MSMLRFTGQRLQNEQVQCALQNLNTVLIFYGLGHSSRYPTTIRVCCRVSTAFCPNLWFGSEGSWCLRMFADGPSHWLRMADTDKPHPQQGRWPSSWMVGRREVNGSVRL